jgi:hypothetical protein
MNTQTQENNFHTHAIKILSKLTTEQANHIMSELVYSFGGVAYIEKDNDENKKEIFKLEEEENIKDLKHIIYSDDMNFSSIIPFLKDENVKFKTGVIDQVGDKLEIVWNI